MCNVSQVIEDVNTLNAGIFLSFGSIDRADASVSDGGAEHLSVEHARQVDIGGVASASGGLQRAINASHALANVLQVTVERQRSRLIDRDKTLDVGHSILITPRSGNAGTQCGGAGRLRGRCGVLLLRSLLRIFLDLLRFAFGSALHIFRLALLCQHGYAPFLPEAVSTASRTLG